MFQIWMLTAWCSIAVATTAASSDLWVDTATAGVYDYKTNPILSPVDKFEWVLGDPTVLVLGNQIHMFANEVFHGINHFVASINNPESFTFVDYVTKLPGSARPYVYYDESANSVILFYEQYEFPFYNASAIVFREAVPDDVDGDGSYTLRWRSGPPTEILSPELPWETIGTERVGNPYVFFNKKEAEYWLYYSASSVHLDDSNIDEPIYIGLAAAPSPRGPFVRKTDKPVQFRGGDVAGTTVLGVGSIKLIAQPGTNDNELWALSNHITQEISSNRTGSSITSVRSFDNGISWEVVNPNLIAPTPDADPATWKQAYCYGFDTLTDPLDDKYMLTYYNARNGWKHASESIGASRVDRALFQ